MSALGRRPWVTAMMAAVVALLLAACDDDDPPPPPTLYNQTTPLAVALPAAVTLPAGGWAMTCAVLGNGALNCWGANQFGQLGNASASVWCYGGYAVCSNGSVVVTPPAAWLQVDAGYAHACGLDSSGAAWCWGYGGDGQLGTGSYIRTATPVQVAGGNTYTQLSVSLSGAMTCAVTAGSALYCWGTGLYGQPGIGVGATTAPLPYQVAPTQTFAQVAVGEWHTCALSPAGTASCWGANAHGQVGDGTTTHRSLPAAVVGGGTYTQIVAGTAHTCALRASGVADCWGAASQIGRSTTTVAEQATPGPVAAAPPFVHLVAGAEHTCALDAAGATWCWGDNSRTQFGDGSTTASLAPRQVAGLPPFVRLAAGGGHTCGVTTAGAMSCWGANTFGQAGRLP